MSKKIVGVDIGGTTIKLAILDTEGNLIDKWQIPTNIENNGELISTELVASIKNKLVDTNSSTLDLQGIGIGVPGPVDESVVKRAVNLGLENFPLRKLVEQELDTPVTLLNDANAAALGELWKGTTELLKNIVFVTLGTGVGGGIVIEGKIVNGTNASGGEIGHIPVKAPGKRICGCGNTNCLECYGSALGMVKTMNELAGKEVVTNAKEIFDRIAQDDELAKETLAITVDYLASAIAGILNTLDPEELVIGGGLSEAGETFLVPFKQALEKYAFPQIKNRIQLRTSALGNDAGVYGAAYLAKSMLELEA